MYRHIAGHVVEKGDIAAHAPGKLFEYGSKAVQGLSHGHPSFQCDDPGGFFLDEPLQIFGIGRKLLPHDDFFPGALQGDGQHLVPDRFGDEIDRVILDALNRQIQFPVPGNHDDFGIRTDPFDSLQKLDTVHSGHFDVRQDNGRPVLFKQGERFFTACRRHHRIAVIGQGDAQHLADTGFIIHEEKGFADIGFFRLKRFHKRHGKKGANSPETF